MLTNTVCYSPVVEIYKGKKIRPSRNRVTLLFNASHYKALLDAVESTGLSFHEVLAHSGKPCEKCKGLTIAVFDETGNPIYIKKGLINLPPVSGANTFKQKGRRQIIDNSTGETYDSIKQVSVIFKINYSTLRWKLRGLLTNDTPFTYAEISCTH